MAGNKKVIEAGGLVVMVGNKSLWTTSLVLAGYLYYEASHVLYMTPYSIQYVSRANPAPSQIRRRVFGYLETKVGRWAAFHDHDDIDIEFAETVIKR